MRNSNPGDLRPRRLAPSWPGQSGIDTNPGGPFAIFATPADGWAALGLWCLDARYLRGLHTARAMIAVFAPPDENDTTGYVHAVERKLGTADLDLSRADVLEALCRAIAHCEESHAEAWTDAEISAGMRLCPMLWPRYRAARIGASIAIPATEITADDLNARELDHIRTKSA